VLFGLLSIFPASDAAFFPVAIALTPVNSGSPVND
jgi:hypothetical protein